MPTSRGPRRWFAFVPAASLLLTMVIAVAEPVPAANCGPFTDVQDSDPACPAILQIYSLGLTAGTSPTTFGPIEPVTRQVLAAMLAASGRSTSRTENLRTALGQTWTLTDKAALAKTTVGANPRFCKADGADVWVSVTDTGEVKRIRASDGTVLGTWTGATGAGGVLVAMGKVFVGGTGGNLWVVNPATPGPVTALTTSLGNSPAGASPVAFDGTNIWVGNVTDSTLSIVSPTGATATMPAFLQPRGWIYDGANMWVASDGSPGMFKYDSAGNPILFKALSGVQGIPAFDGSVMWVPMRDSDTLLLIRPSNGELVATLSGNGLSQPLAAAYDGQRVLVTNAAGGGMTVSVWRAADRFPLGSVEVGPVFSNPYAPCSDGIQFWIPLSGTGQLARF